MIKKIDHIAFAVNDVEGTIKQFCDVIGLITEDVKVEIIEERKFKTSMIPIGDGAIQVMGSTAPEGWVGKYITEHGEGMHHVCLEVDDINATIDTEPREGHGGSKIIFLNPEAANVLMELVEY
jgi:methylmalonyl-CoA/ethylmalonyl-CoA epimerase